MPKTPPNIPSPFNLELNDRHSQGNWLFKILAGSTPSVTWLTQEQFSVVLNSVGRKIGDFDEQATWEGGRGGERFSDDATKYKDALQTCTWIKGHAFPSPQWHISTGYRDAERSQPGSVSWRGVFGSTRYRSRTVTASASSNRAHIWLWIRRVGTPGTLTVELQTDNAGKPSGTVLQTATVTTTQITDVVSVKYDFAITSQAVTSATVYHVVTYGASTDVDGKHWEVGGDVAASAGFYKASQFSGDGTADTWSMYCDLTDAETDRRWWYFRQGTNWCKVSNEATASLYKWNQSTSIWEVVAGHGLGQVTGRPIEVNGIVYFPQGDAVAIRSWDGTSWAAQTITVGQGAATGLCAGYDQTAKTAQIVRYNNALVSGGTTTGLAVSVSRAAAVATYADALVFQNSTRVGSTTGTINSIMQIQNGAWIFKTDEVGEWNYDQYTELDFGVKDTPSADNGIASTPWNSYVFFNWLFSTERVYSGTVDDVGLGFRGASLPYGREGVDSAYRRYINSLFIAKDAGANGTSSITLYDGLNEHEFARAWASGRRIRDVAIQTVSGGRNRLWFDCGGDSVYVNLPFYKNNPLYDPAVTYMHEAVLESSEIDMGTATKLPKFIKEVAATIKNLDGKGIYVDFDYQVDKQIGLTGYVNWKMKGAFTQSPEDTVKINEGNLRKFAYRLRMHTDNCLIPPDVRGVVPNGFARSPMRKIFSIECDITNVQVNGKPQDADSVIDWLEEAASSAYLVAMRSLYRPLDDYMCVLAPPNQYPIKANPEKTRVSFTLLEL